jgi:hypothetical protein
MKQDLLLKTKTDLPATMAIQTKRCCSVVNVPVPIDC